MPVPIHEGPWQQGIGVDNMGGYFASEDLHAFDTPEERDTIGCDECGIAKPLFGPCPNPRCPTHKGSRPQPRQEPQQPTPGMGKYDFFSDTHLTHEVDALTGYDRNGLFHAFLSAVQARHEAKRAISRIRAHMVREDAKYESKGTMPSQAENERSARLAEIKEDARARYYRNPEMETVPGKRKDDPETQRIVHLTEKEVEDRAKADPAYKRFLDQQGEERRSHADMKRQYDEAWADYEEATGVVEYLNHQLTDRKSLIYYGGAERAHSNHSQS